jgi:hypothetical protein
MMEVFLFITFISLNRQETDSPIVQNLLHVHSSVHSKGFLTSIFINILPSSKYPFLSHWNHCPNFVFVQAFHWSQSLWITKYSKSVSVTFVLVTPSLHSQFFFLWPNFPFVVFQDLVLFQQWFCTTNHRDRWIMLLWMRLSLSNISSSILDENLTISLHSRFLFFWRLPILSFGAIV